MADIRINSLPSTATSFNTDDYIAIDGASGGTRKMLAATLPLTDVTLGASGPSVKSTLSARAPRQGLVFDGTAGATVTSVPAFGTADYSIAAWLVWSGSSAQTIVDGSSSVAFFVNGSGGVAVFDRISSSTKAITANGVVTAGKPCFVTYTRAGQIYVNGLASGAVVADTSNYTGTIGSVGQNYDGSQKFSGFLAVNIYNRALSASEVVALYEAGAPAGADYNSASNTSLLTGANSDFSSAGNWNVTGSTTISGGKLNLSTGDAAWNALALLSKGKRYRLTITVDSITAGIVEYYNGSSYVTFASTAGTYTVEFTCAATFSPGLHLRSSGGNAVLDTALYYPLGLLLAPDAAQAGGGLTWYDTSGNAANITLPASGVSWNVPTSGKMATSLNVNAAASLFASTSNSTSISDVDTTAAFITKGSGTPRLYFGNENAANRPFLQAGVGGGALFMCIQPYGGNALFGSLTDSGNGKIQLATHTTSAGGIGFGTDISLYRDTNSTLNGTAPGGYALTRTGINGVGLATGLNVASDAKTANDAIGISLSLQNSSSAAKTYGQIYAEINSATASSENGSLVLRTIKAGTLTTALTLDSNQNATFAGNVTLNNNGIYQSATTAVLRSNGTNAGCYVRANGTGKVIIDTGAGLDIQIGSLQLPNAYVAGAPTATGYVTIKDSSGTTYKVLVST